MDYYKVLGVSPTSTKEEIKKAYKKNASIYHPDVCRLDKKICEKKMEQINEAYESLFNKAKSDLDMTIEIRKPFYYSDVLDNKAEFYFTDPITNKRVVKRISDRTPPSKTLLTIPNLGKQRNGIRGNLYVRITIINDLRSSRSSSPMSFEEEIGLFSKLSLFFQSIILFFSDLIKWFFKGIYKFIFNIFKTIRIFFIRFFEAFRKIPYLIKNFFIQIGNSIASTPSNVEYLFSESTYKVKIFFVSIKDRFIEVVGLTWNKIKEFFENLWYFFTEHLFFVILLFSFLILILGIVLFILFLI